ncbi:sterol desaturase family protein, partial [Pelagibacterales bacterium]|nr:sterol desaturase family protein [Pelagibacterales bacterium]
ILAEVIYSFSKNLGYYSLKDSLAGYGLLAGNIIINFLTKGSVLFFYIYLYQFKLVAINDLLSPVFAWVLTFITIDFIFYWYHRCSHRVRFLWAVHMNHHSSEEMNFSVSLRQAWFGPLTKIPFFMFMPLLGFDPIITAAAGIILTLWGVLGHTQWINRLGPLEYIFVTPSAHRVHHGSNEEYLDKNYGNFLIIWDRLFGTFADEKSKVVYGIVDNVKTFNPLKITFQFWITMYQDYKNAKSLKDKILCFVGRPEWKPDK